MDPNQLTTGILKNTIYIIDCILSPANNCDYNKHYVV